MISFFSKLKARVHCHPNEYFSLIKKSIGNSMLFDTHEGLLSGTCLNLGRKLLSINCSNFEWIFFVLSLADFMLVDTFCSVNCKNCLCSYKNLTTI